MDDNGNVQPLAAAFWQQTQVGNGNDHLRDKLILSDVIANTINQSFELLLNSSIVRLELYNMPQDIYELKSVIWTVKTTSGETRSAILDVTGVTAPPTHPYPIPFNLKAYLAFDPDFMQVAVGGKVKITLIGDKSYEWSTTSQDGMTYTKGTRYYATVSGNWMQKVPFIFTIKTNQSNQILTLYQRAASNSPANLTIDWGDGSGYRTFNQGDPIGETIDTHNYVNAGDYTVTIYSNNPNYSSKQIPQITFYKYSSVNQLLTAVVTPFPNMGADATSFEECFYQCTQLTTIPADLFRYNTQATSFRKCFIFCNGLTSIPSGLFSYNTAATNFNSCFYGCTGLSSIPAELFNNNTQTIDFRSCFANCTGLTAIPANLFTSNDQAQIFENCFNGCTGLTAIPMGLFDNNLAATSFHGCFAGCTGLTAIPENLFQYNTQAKHFLWSFGGCTGLTAIPAGLFSTNTNAINFLGCFINCAGLTAVPADLFRYNVEATNFSNCFYNCTGLTAVPADLFTYNVEATNFSYCFYNCSGLTALPSHLFRYNTKATDFSYCFSGCIKLQLNLDIFPSPAPIFGKPDFFNDRAMDFTDFCKNVGSHPTAISGTAPKLWSFNYGAGVTTTGCFTGANVTNAGDIPNNWK
ncbi:MAG TPA: leucine-rich repeat protein [Bacteroidales bacterium]|nr:leucine-rich repeat protein [Bacteroidales bacterium]HPK29934.1 leucine-rich repeat protein [Bacteroidales bacterium]